MSCLVLGVVLSLWCGAIVKPERQGVAEVKSSVSGIGIEVHGVSGGSARVDLRCAMSNSCKWAVAVGAVESRYFGQARATSLCGGVEDGAGPAGSSRPRGSGVSGGMAGPPGGS